MYVNRRRAAKKRGQRFLIIYYQLARVWKSSDRMLPVVIIFCHCTLWRCMWMDSPVKDDNTAINMQCIAKLYQFLFLLLFYFILYFFASSTSFPFFIDVQRHKFNHYYYRFAPSIWWIIISHYISDWLHMIAYFMVSKIYVSVGYSYSLHPLLLLVFMCFTVLLHC